MVVQSVLLSLILLLVWPAMETLAAGSSLSKPGCQETCGELAIPYPFGTGNRSCYHDEWFEIDCQKNTANVSQSVLFLKKLNMQVLRIILPDKSSIDPMGRIYVKSPIISSDCNGSSNNSTGPVVDLRGSNFVFSQFMTRFAAVGRDSRAIMADIEPDLTGCLPGNRTCSELITNCCDTTIPSDLKVFNADFESISTGENTEGKECKFAFMVHKDWFYYGLSGTRREWLGYNSTTVLSSLQSKDIPAVLEWTLSNWEGEDWDEVNVACGTLSVGNQDRTTQYCYCKKGFEGNAYIANGCQDINECEDVKLHTCPSACENTYGNYKCRNSLLKRIIIALSSILGLLIGMTSLWILYKIIKRRWEIRMKKKFFIRNGGLLLKQKLSSCQVSVESKFFTSEELEKATGNFNESRILGRGGQGTVYKGMLSDGRIVAVKKSKIEDQGKVETIINEVAMLSQIIHRNVVTLLGFCLETEVPSLVYEFIPNGTLSQYLHDQTKKIIVSWQMRLQMAIEVAGALSYLHFATSIPIHHRDIKSVNILLDDKYRAKIGDFGTSRSMPLDKSHVTTFVYGTFGYLDPEYFQSGQFTDKSDVYSFGVVLVELLTGEKAISLTRTEERGLATYFTTEMEENRLFKIVDTRIANQGKEDEIEAVANLAKRCLDMNGKNRPDMREVHMELERIGLLQRTVNGEETNEVESVRNQETRLWDLLRTATFSGL